MWIICVAIDKAYLGTWNRGTSTAFFVHDSRYCRIHTLWTGRISLLYSINNLLTIRNRQVLPPEQERWQVTITDGWCSSIGFRRWTSHSLSGYRPDHVDGFFTWRHWFVEGSLRGANRWLSLTCWCWENGQTESFDQTLLSFLLRSTALLVLGCC